MEQPSIVMPDAMLVAIDTQPGNSRSEWVRDAVAMRLFVEELEEDADNDLPAEWWQDAVENYLDDREQPASIEA